VRIRGRRRAPGLGRIAKVVAAVAVIPVGILLLAVLGFEIWQAVHGRPNELPATLGSLALWLVLYFLPILGAFRLGSSGLRRADVSLGARKRSPPRVPASVSPARIVSDLGPELPGLPLFSRPLAHLWSTVAEVVIDGIELDVFEVVHGDLLGESGPAPQGGGGLSIVSCAGFRVQGDLPLVVVRPARSRPFSLPPGMARRETELEAFNRSFRLFSVEPYTASVLVGARTIAVIQKFDPRFSVELGGDWVVIHAPRLRTSGVQRLIRDAQALARVFPRVAGSLYPADAEPGI
jgi:hypothetical protein